MADEWIGKAEWNDLLRQSQSLTGEARAAVNRRIRSPRLKVRGIDDRHTPHPAHIEGR